MVWFGMVWPGMVRYYRVNMYVHTASKVTPLGLVVQRIACQQKYHEIEGCLRRLYIYVRVGNTLIGILVVCSLYKNYLNPSNLPQEFITQPEDRSGQKRWHFTHFLPRPYRKIIRFREYHVQKTDQKGVNQIVRKHPSPKKLAFNRFRIAALPHLGDI